MALKPTIYKFNIHLSDMDRNIYETLILTVAQHPSESVERMMARVIVYCLEYEPGLSFTRGVSSTDEPDLWLHSDAGETTKWIEIGEPSAERIKKATRLCRYVSIYSTTTKSDIWWSKLAADVEAYSLQVHQIPWTELQSLAPEIKRTTEITCSIADRTCYLSLDELSFTVSHRELKGR